MQSVVKTNRPLSAASDAFVTGAGGVAALDTPHLTQTKLEIRSLVAEIAELSATQLSQAEFLRAVLPRICSAMGATAAAFWRIDIASRTELVGHYRLPDLLMPTGATDLLTADLPTAVKSTVAEPHADKSPANESLSAQDGHAKILGCIAAEGSAVLVPPKSVRIAASRPTNPLDECLLVVPIKVDDRCEMLLEVIQQPSGGPAAQRGYLRFVAQMADLMSDFLRRDRLRHFAQESVYVQTLQDCLLAISSAANQAAKLQQAATYLSQLVDAELVLVAERRHILGWPIGYRVRAISHVPAFDSRSELVMAAQRLLATQSSTRSPTPARFSLVATDELTNDESMQDNQLSAPARLGQNIRTLIGCSHLGQLRLDNAGHCYALMAFDRTVDLTTVRQRAEQLARAFQSLLHLPADSMVAAGQSLQPAAQNLPLAVTTRQSWRSRLERGLVRASTALLVLALTLFPTPDNIASVAVLESVNKELYYAPSSATIDTIYVDTHQAVKQGTPLIKLADSQLQARLDELLGQQASITEQLRYDKSVRNRGGKSSQEDIQLTSRIDQSEINLRAIEEQLKIVQAQIDQLTITARSDALVTTWDARNQLHGRPVSAGQLLLTTHQPNAAWQLRVSVPERQLGRLRDAMSKSREGLPVQFSLSSHPSEVRHGRLVTVSEQLVKDDKGVAQAMGIVAIDGHSLPAKADGAVARATIACGRTFAGWLAIRDAYREANAWWRLNW